MLSGGRAEVRHHRTDRCRGGIIIEVLFFSIFFWLINSDYSYDTMISNDEVFLSS